MEWKDYTDFAVFCNLPFIILLIIAVCIHIHLFGIFLLKQLALLYLFALIIFGGLFGPAFSNDNFKYGNKKPFWYKFIYGFLTGSGYINFFLIGPIISYIFIMICGIIAKISEVLAWLFFGLIILILILNLAYKNE